MQRDSHGLPISTSSAEASAAFGRTVESYLKAPVALKPLATVSIAIPTDDVRGGTGANFIVDWAATGEIAEPVVEALMVGGIANAHYAFISQGRPTRTAGRK